MIGVFGIQNYGDAVLEECCIVWYLLFWVPFPPWETPVWWRLCVFRLYSVMHVHDTAHTHKHYKSNQSVTPSQYHLSTVTYLLHSHSHSLAPVANAFSCSVSLLTTRYYIFFSITQWREIILRSTIEQND